MVESVVELTIWCGSESWVPNTRERRRVGVFDFKCLRKVKGVGVMQIIRNKDTIGRCENKACLLERVDQSTLRWFGQIERTGEGRLTKR